MKIVQHELRHSAKYSKSEEPSVSWMGDTGDFDIFCWMLSRYFVTLLSILYDIMLYDVTLRSEDCTT